VRLEDHVLVLARVPEAKDDGNGSPAIEEGRFVDLRIPIERIRSTVGPQGKSWLAVNYDPGPDDDVIVRFQTYETRDDLIAALLGRLGEGFIREVIPYNRWYSAVTLSLLVTALCWMFWSIYDAGAGGMSAVGVLMVGAVCIGFCLALLAWAMFRHVAANVVVRHRIAKAA
jgi:hypothetical protein